MWFTIECLHLKQQLGVVFHWGQYLVPYMYFQVEKEMKS